MCYHVIYPKIMLKSITTQLFYKKIEKRNMVKVEQRINGLFEDFWYSWKERKTPYIDNDALKAYYEESRKLFEEKMKNNELLGALDYLDIANLWEKKSRLAKNINDNKDNMPLTLSATLFSYGASVAAAVSAISSVFAKGYDTPSDLLFWGSLLGVLMFTIVGIYQQKRLKRLVEEHKDYAREFKETTKLIERKR